MKMRQIYIISALVVVLVVVLSAAFTFEQTLQEERNLSSDLQYRTRLLADSLIESVEPSYQVNSAKSLEGLLAKFTGRSRLAGLAVYDSKGRNVAASTDFPEAILTTPPLVADAIANDAAKGDYDQVYGRNLYLFAEPLHNTGGAVIGVLLVAQSADYIGSYVAQIWEGSALRFLILLLVFLLILALLIRLIILRPLHNLVESVKTARTRGETGAGLEGIREHAFFKPLVGEISKMTKSLLAARLSAAEEARMRLEKLETPWTAERLKEFIKAYLKDRKIFLVSNREPYIHSKTKNEITAEVPASGMVTALEPVMEACGGTWIAHGSGNADRETADANGKIQVPPDDPKYTLKRVWLSEKEVNGHYVGFSNEALWPLCHLAHTRPIFRKEDWKEYRRVNNKFAQALLAEIKDVDQPLILVQDFHFALLPAIVKSSRPDAQICLFWHIPWPSAETFSICPWRKEIIAGMIGADILGFHTQAYCNNFMDTVGKEMESMIDLERFAITHGNHTTYIKPFPISIAFASDKPALPADRSVLEKLGIGTIHIALGVDRMDYSKGILERLKGVELFLDEHPDYKSKFTFLQIAPPSREAVAKYREYNEAVTREAERINKKFAEGDWRPVVLEKKHYTHEELAPLYRLSNVCLVTSLHDGMNLVAKEFVAARDDEMGVLILSQFTGASRGLAGALIINPYNGEQIAESIYGALTMPAAEQKRRMHAMRESVKNYNIYRWSAELIKAATSF